MWLCRIFPALAKYSRIRRNNMNRQVIKAPYTAPLAELIAIAQPLHLLVSVSVEAGIDDWEEGDEL